LDIGEHGNIAYPDFVTARESWKVELSSTLGSGWMRFWIPCTC